MSASDYVHEHRIDLEDQARHHLSAVKVNNYYVKINGLKEPRPTTRLIDHNQAEIIGRKIINYSLNLGSSKDGLGMGFFGLLLEAKNPSSKPEWLVVTIDFASSHHCLLDLKWIEAYTDQDVVHSPQYTHSPQFKPSNNAWVVYGYPSKIIKNDFTPFIKGSVIIAIDLQPNSCKMTLEKDNQKHLLEILNTDPRLCPWPGAEYKVGKETRYALPKAFKEGTDHIGNYIIFMEEDGQIYI